MTQEIQEIKAFEDLWDAVVLLQQAIDYSYVEALGETLQNLVNGNRAQEVDGQPDEETAKALTQRYEALQLQQYTPEQIRRMIQFTFLKAAKEDGLQMNHQMTPDAIGLLVAFMVEHLTQGKDALTIGDFASGSGNLLSTILLFLQKDKKKIVPSAIDNDEVLVHLSLQSFLLEGLDVRVMLQDGLADLLVEALDVAVSDLPIGYYPIDAHAATFETHNEEGHSFAHHLLIEQHVRYLKEAGVGLFIVPTNLFETEEGQVLLSYLQRETFVQAMLAFPRNLFKNTHYSKSLLIVQKKGHGAKQVRQVLLGDIPEIKNMDKFRKFTQTFEQWAKEIV